MRGECVEGVVLAMVRWAGPIEATEKHHQGAIALG